MFLNEGSRKDGDIAKSRFLLGKKRLWADENAQWTTTLPVNVGGSQLEPQSLHGRRESTLACR